MHKLTRRRAYCRPPTRPPVSASPRPRVPLSPRPRVPASPCPPVPLSPSPHIVVLTVGLLLSVFCLLPAAPASSQTVDVQPIASPSPSPSPSPSATPLTGLHQWGAVTLFHGLPSDRV